MAHQRLSSWISFWTEHQQKISYTRWQALGWHHSFTTKSWCQPLCQTDIISVHGSVAVKFVMGATQWSMSSEYNTGPQVQPKHLRCVIFFGPGWIYWRFFYCHWHFALSYPSSHLVRVAALAFAWCVRTRIIEFLKECLLPCCFVLLTREWERLETRPPIALGSESSEALGLDKNPNFACWPRPITQKKFLWKFKYKPLLAL